MHKKTVEVMQLIKAEKFEEAVTILKEAADSGDVEAQFQLGLLYYKGKAVEADGDIAFEWLKKAYEGGHSKAPYYIGRLNSTVPNLEAAFKWYEVGAERGDHVCLARMGLCYLRGEGVPQL